MIKSFGLVIGIMVGLVLAVLLCRFANNNQNAKTQYDERQKEIRGRAYQYAFHAVLLYEVAMLIVDGWEMLPIDRYLMHFGGIMVGCLVLACYCIWKDVYWGLNNNRRRYIAVFTASVALNVIPIVGALKSGEGLGSSIINLMVLIMLAVILVEMLIKRLVDRGSEE